MATHTSPGRSGKSASRYLVPVQIFLTKLLKSEVPAQDVAASGGLRRWRCWNLYRQYAADCIRLSQTMTAADKQTLLGIASAWENRVQEAERQEKRKA